MPSYPFIEISLSCSDAAAQEAFWCHLFEAQVLFRGRMMGQPFIRLLACGVTLVFREDPEFKPPPGPEEERLFCNHLGLRVPNLDEAIKELEARGARFVLTPEQVKTLQGQKGEGGEGFLITDYIAPPLTRARIAAGELRHEVAILLGPDNLWIELNEIHEPLDTQWYPGSSK